MNRTSSCSSTSSNLSSSTSSLSYEKTSYASKSVDTFKSPVKKYTHTTQKKFVLKNVSVTSNNPLQHQSSVPNDKKSLPNYHNGPSGPYPVLPIIPQRQRNISHGQLPMKTSSFKPRVPPPNNNLPSVKNEQRKTSVAQRIANFSRMESKSTDSISTPLSRKTPSSPKLEVFKNKHDRPQSLESTSPSDRSSTASELSEGHQTQEVEAVPHLDKPSNGVRVAPVEETQKSKVFKVATELVTTEIAYVRVLGIVDTVG